MSGIVLTTDLSEESKRVMQPVRALAQKLGLSVTVLSIVEDIPFEPAAGGMIAVYPDRTQIRADWQKGAEAFADELGRDVCTRVAIVEAADVPRAIVEFAHSQHADYVALATHGRSGLRRLLLGSVAEQVARHAHVPVLLYPPPAA